MCKKLLFLRREALLPTLLFLLLLVLTANNAKADTYYWRLAGGTADWGNLGRWAAVPGGPGNVYSSAPSSDDDVFIDASGIAAGNSTITFTNTASVRNLTISTTGCPSCPSPTFVMTNTGQTFDIWGDATFQSGMNFNSFLGTMRFISNDDNLSKVIETNGNTFYGRWEYAIGTNTNPASVTINGDFTLRNGLLINPKLITDQFVINGNSTFIHSTAYNPIGSNPGTNLNVTKGEIYFNAPFTATANSYQFYVQPNGKLFSRANGSVTGIYNSGIVNLNYAGTNPTYTIGYLDINSAYLTPSSSEFNFSNTIINVLNTWHYGRGTSSPFSIVSTGSHLRFNATALYFYTQDYTYHNVTLEPSGGAGYFQLTGSSYGISNITPTFNDFVIRRNTYYMMTAAPSTFRFTSNTYKIDPGLTVSSQYSNIQIAVNNLCDIVGTCQQPIRIMNLNFRFFAGTTVLADNLFTDGITVNPLSPLYPNYNPGSLSRVITGTSDGWNFSTAPGRTLIWVGPLPANTSDPNTYGNWTDPNNWRDIAIDANADNPVTGGPNFTGGTPVCPPTFRDSVVFMNNSYVDVDAVHFIYSSGVNFMGTGVINGGSNLEWEIYAGLTFSANTTNNFMGTVWFRNDKNYECQIITKNVAFRKGIFMNAINAAGNWRLTDGDLIALTPDIICMNGWTGAQKTVSFRMARGHLHTGLTNCSSVNSYKMRLFGLGASGGTMSWYGSDIEIVGQGQVFEMQNPAVLNCGVSHLKLDYRSVTPGAQQSSELGNKTYYRVSLLSTAGVSSQPSHRLSITQSTGISPAIVDLFVDANTLPGALTLAGNATNPVRIRKATVNAPTAYFGEDWCPGCAFIGTIDSLIMTGNVYFHNDLRIRSYVQMAPGKNYVFGTATRFMELMAASSAASYSTCVPVPTNYTGATANMNGSCSALIRIEGGRFIQNSPTPLVGQYLNLVNNTITSPGTGTNNAGVMSGITTGWTLNATPPRKLRWVDPSGLPYNATTNPSNWNDASRWEQILPSYAPAPQCPPNKTDTIIFDNTSFPSLNQRFAVNTPMEVASMYWYDNVSTSSGIVGNGLISIYGSLRLPDVNQANFMNGSTNNFEFKGIPTAQFPSFTIRTNKHRYRANLTFLSASDNARWDLQDSLAFYGSLTLNRGKLYTNTFPMYSQQGGFAITALNTTDLRTIDITNTKVYATLIAPAGGYWRVNNLGPASNTTVNTLGSIIRVTAEGGSNTVFNGGGYVYNDVIMATGGSAPCVMNITNGDRFGFIDILAGGPARIQGGPNMIAERVRSNSSNFTLSSTLSIIDTVELLAGVSTFTSSNRIRDMLQVASNTTWNIGANEVQWFDNDCPVSLIGLSTTNYIALYSTIGGVPAYLRKDSSTVCADYIYMRDIWCVGNGNNPAAGCTSFGNSVANTLCPTANSWIPSSCDTISDDGTLCGAWAISAPNRGRAAFTAGEWAVNMGVSPSIPDGTCRGWDYRPYPPIPSIQLTAGTPSICAGQSVPLTISGIGKVPFYMDYTDNFGNTYAIDITSAAQLASYNPTTHAFTYTTTVSPSTSTTYYAGVIAIERCFNNTSPTGSGSLAVTVNPYPQINNAVLATDVCSGNAVTITPTTTVPATVNWTSVSYSGVSGHGTSGSGTITETMNTSNAAPTAVVYTLTPTANGCTGTPVNFTVNLNPRPNVVPGATQNLDCNTPTAVVSASSSTAGVQFGWTGPGLVSGAATNAATVNAAGTYSVLVTNPTTGCTSNSSVTVNYIADNSAPVITCPSNISVNTTDSTCNASVAVPNPVINDNCGVTLLTWSMGGVTPGNSPGTGINYVGTQTFNLGSTPVTYTIRDASNNQTTCSFNVTVIDNVNPTITCPSNMSAFTSSSSCSASVITPNPTVSDNCTVSALNWTITQGATTVASGSGNLGTRVFNLGTSTVNYTVTDASGNSSTCSYTVTVTDNVNPTISCPSNMTAFTSAASCSANVATPNPTVSDNCTVASLSWTITQGVIVQASGTGNLGTHAFNLGTSTVNYIVTDGSGNSSNCSYTVTVTDNVNPTISCPSNMSVFTSSSACNATVATPNPTVSDNCAVSSLSWTITQGALVVASGTGNVGTQVFNLGTSTVNYTATDASGNSSGCSYTVTVTDNVAPTIDCPANVTANTSSTSCDASIAIPNVTFSDNCTVSSVTWIMSGATVGTSPSSGINQVGTQTFNSGTTTIFYTVRDAANNPSTCSFTVTVTDATPPVVQPLDTVFGQCSASVPVAVANDNCSGLMNGTTSDPLSYNAQGTFTVTWTFTDAAGNSTTSNQIVVVDNNLPLTPPVLPVIYGECSATVPYPDLTSGCSGTITGTTSDPLYYDQQGTYTVTWNFDDGMGNTVNANQTVIVDDTTAAVPNPIPNVLTECSVTLPIPIAIDNCVDTIYGTTTFPTTYSSQGTFTLTWTFDDGNGNPINVNQTVIIADTTDPSLSNCPANISVSNDNGDCGAIVSWTPPTAVDNCSGFTVTSSHNPGDFFNLGTTTVTYTLTDAGGNTTTCTFDVEVTDNEAPVIIACPADTSVSTDPLICGAVVNWTVPNASDNCPGVIMTATHNSGDLFPTGTTTVTYTATDAAGNTATCSFDVTVNDTEAPVFTNCPSDITVNNDPGVCGAIVNWTAPTATDNCSAVTLVSNYNPGDLFPTGTTVVTYTATDAIGNSFTCSFDVTVNDVEAPVISGLSDLSVCEGNAPSWTEVITDNCPGVTYTSNYTSGTTFPLGNTTVTYTATDASGNQTTVSFVVNVYPSGSVNVTVSPSASFCVGEEVNLQVTNASAGATYSWSFNNTQLGTGSTYQFSSTDINQSGTYTVEVILPGGCLAYGNAAVTIDYCELLIPEAVTPNADGMNDTWYIENLENYPNTTVQIVNRWGAVVFESDDYKNDWDGTSQNGMNIGGDELPEGTFYYVLRIGGDEASKFYHKVYTGYIYLKRK